MQRPTRSMVATPPSCYQVYLIFTTSTTAPVAFLFPSELAEMHVTLFMNWKLSLINYIQSQEIVYFGVNRRVIRRLGHGASRSISSGAACLELSRRHWEFRWFTEVRKSLRHTSRTCKTFISVIFHWTRDSWKICVQSRN